MPIFAPGVAQGVTQGMDAYQNRQVQAQEMEWRKLQIESARAQQARDLRAQEGAGATLGALYPTPPQVSPQSQQAPAVPPGQASLPTTQAFGPPQTPAQQLGSPQPPGQQPMGASPAQPQPAMPPQIPPYRTVSQMAGQLPPQPTTPSASPAVVPAAPPQVGAMPQQPQQPSITVSSLVEAMRKSGVPQSEWLGQLEKLKPVMDEANREQVTELRIQTQAAQAGQRAAEAEAKRMREEERRRHEGVIEKQGQQRADADTLRAKTKSATSAAAANAGGNVDAKSLDDQIALAREGMPKSQIVGGWGKQATAQWNKVESGAIKQIMEEKGVSRADAAKEFSQKQLGYRAEGVSQNAESRTGTTISTNIRIASDEAKQMIDVARKFSDKLPRGQFPTINSITNAAQKGVGGPEIVQLDTALNSLINAYARAINPRGVPTVNDKEHARGIINSALSKGQLNAAFDVMSQEMTVALKAAERKGRSEPAGGNAAGWSPSDEARLKELEAKHGAK